MEDQVFLKKFVSSIEIEQNRFSCLLIALLDARKLTGRNTESSCHELNVLGNDNTFLSPYSFIGAINYLLILDMIGEIFKLDHAMLNENNPNNIYKALKQFAPLIDDRDIDTIIGLRNSLAHNYGLVNIPIGSNPNLIRRRHKFILVNSKTSYLIEYPVAGIWSGDFTEKSDSTSTKIGYDKLIDLVESVYCVLRKEIENGAVSLALSNDISELKARFTIMY